MCTSKALQIEPDRESMFLHSLIYGHTHKSDVCCNSSPLLNEMPIGFLHAGNDCSCMLLLKLQD